MTAPLDGLDLNLLVVLRELLRTKSATRAAEALGSTQPSVSRALGTLREAFGDPILVRAGRGLAPTPFAQSLRVPLEQLLESIGRLRSVGDFDPQTANRRFRLLIPDILGCGILPSLAGVFSEHKSLSVDVLGLEADALSGLLNGSTDLVVMAPRLEHPELFLRRVGATRPGWSIVFGKRHPFWNSAVTHEGWLSSEHVQLIPEGRPETLGSFDEQLASREETRTVRSRVSNLSGLPATLETTGWVTTLPTPTAKILAAGRELRVHPHPLYGDLELSVHMIWHGSNQADVGHQWLRGEVRRAMESFWLPG